jgi:hypothetical protein
MNSNDDKSPISPDATTSNASSSTASLPTVMAELPLFGLTKLTMDKMSDEELRARVVRIQQLRVSPQTFRAAVEEDKESDKGPSIQSMFSDYV